MGYEDQREFKIGDPPEIAKVSGLAEKNALQRQLIAAWEPPAGAYETFGLDPSDHNAKAMAWLKAGMGAKFDTFLIEHHVGWMNVPISELLELIADTETNQPYMN